MYIVYDFKDWDFKICKSEKEAKIELKKILQMYRDAAFVDGWPENLHEQIGYAKCEKEIVLKTHIADKSDYFSDEEWEEAGYDSNFDEIVDYIIDEGE